MKWTCKPQPQVYDGSAGVNSVCRCHTVSGVGRSAGSAVNVGPCRGPSLGVRAPVNKYSCCQRRRRRLQHLHVVFWDEAPLAFQLALQPAWLPGRGHCRRGGGGGGGVRGMNAFNLHWCIFLLFLQRAIFHRISPLNLRSFFFIFFYQTVRQMCRKAERCANLPGFLISSKSDPLSNVGGGSCRGETFGVNVWRHGREETNSTRLSLGCADRIFSSSRREEARTCPAGLTRIFPACCSHLITCDFDPMTRWQSSTLRLSDEADGSILNGYRVVILNSSQCLGTYTRLQWDCSCMEEESFPSLF